MKRDQSILNHVAQWTICAALDGNLGTDGTFPQMEF